MTSTLVAVALLSACSSTSPGGSSTQTSGATPASSAGGGGGAFPVTHSGPPCKYLTTADIATVLPGSLSTTTRVDPQTKADICLWNIPPEGGGTDLLVSNLAAFQIDGNKRSLQDMLGGNGIPGLGDFGGFVSKQAIGAQIKFYKGNYEVTFSLSKPNSTSADFDALVVLAKKVAGQL